GLVARDRDIEVNDSWPLPDDGIRPTPAVRVQIDDEHATIGGPLLAFVERGTSREREPVEGAEPRPMIPRRVVQAARQRAGVLPVAERRERRRNGAAIRRTNRLPNLGIPPNAAGLRQSAW